MAEMKYLNTRIQLKYDSFTNWENSTVILKAGEVAIAYLGETVSEKIKGENRPVLFKVGDGVKTFTNLPWASALAADVYDWAKKEHLDLIDLPDIPVVDSETGKFVTDVEWDAVNNQLIIHRADESKDYGKVTADEGEIEADKIHDTFAIKGEGVVSTKATGDAVTISVDLGEYTKTEDLVDNDTVTVVEEGTGIKVKKAVEGNVHTYTISHQEKPTGGTAEAATAGSGRTYVTEVLVDELGHIAGVKTATETVVDTNTAHTHVDGKGVTVEGNGGIEGEVKIDLDVKFNENLVTKNDKKYLQLLDATDNALITEFDVTEFVKDGMLESVTIDKEKNEITFTWNTDGAATVTTVKLSDIADIYTGGTTDDITVHVSNENVITATLNKNFALADDLSNYQPVGNYKTKQGVVKDPEANGSTLEFISNITQNENGEITPTKKTVNLSEYAKTADLPVVNDGKFTVSGVGSLTGSGEMTANQAGDTVANLDIADKGVTTAKIADKAVTTAQINDKAVGAEQTKAYQATAPKTAEDITSEEVWVFYCGTSDILV